MPHDMNALPSQVRRQNPLAHRATRRQTLLAAGLAAAAPLVDLFGHSHLAAAQDATPMPGESGEITHRFIETNGIRMHIAEQGRGPLVVLLHGLPETWHSYRFQLPFLAEAGFHAVAPDMRGYGQTDFPSEFQHYTQLHLVGDVIGLLDALGEQRAVVVGHDWGAPVAWNTALMRPDRVRGVVGLSVPYIPRGPVSDLALFRQALGDGFYMQYFQQPGVADAEMDADPRLTMRRILYTLSGDALQESGEPPKLIVPEGGTFVDILKEPPSLPVGDWLTEEDLDIYEADFERTGFTGGINYIRAIDLSWELMGAWQNAPVLPPALYVTGDLDLTQGFPGMQEALLPHLTTFVPNLTRMVLLPGIGHWTQQEAPTEVNAAILKFLLGL